MKCEVLERLSLNLGFYAIQTTKELDIETFRKSEREIGDFEKEARKKDS